MINEDNGSSETRSVVRSGPSRRSVLATGAAATALSGFPYISRARAAQTLKFWQFYAPGGGVATQVKWFEDVVKGWNDTHDVKVELDYVPNNAYMDGTKLPTAFASGAGPGSVHHQPRRFPALLQWRRAARPDAVHRGGGARRFPSEASSPIARSNGQDLWPALRKSSRWRCITASTPSTEAGLTEKDVPKTWDELLDRRQEADHRQAVRRAVRNRARLLPEFHLVSLHVAGRRRVPDRGRQERVQFAGVVQALKFWQDAINRASRRASPSAAAAGMSCPISPPAIAPCRTSASGRSAQLREGAPNFKYGIFKLPTPPGGKYLTIGGGWAFVANAKGKNPEAAGKFCAWALGLDERRIRSSASSIGAPRPRATCRRANRRSRRARPPSTRAF